MLPVVNARPPAKTTRAFDPSAVTKIVLERVAGGPHFSGQGWPQDKIVLRPQASNDFIPPDDFLHLANWLKKSGFFARKSGYSANLTPTDIGYLRITVIQGGKQKQVYSYNGERDSELWQTEMTIRGVASVINPKSKRVAWLRMHIAAGGAKSRN